MNEKGTIIIAGIGPGKPEWIPPAVTDALEKADILLGYRAYLEQIETLFPNIPRESSGMRQETERAQRAIELSLSGKNPAVISGGDAGIYGMAGLILEKAEAMGAMNQLNIEILPGISALNAAAALLGAPLMTDFAVVSLSDYLTPLDTILTHVKVAVENGFVLCLYNPKSQTRVEPFERTLAILREALLGNTPVGIVQKAFREGQRVSAVPLSLLHEQEIGMDCILIVGTVHSRMIDGRMVTPRGYKL